MSVDRDIKYLYIVNKTNKERNKANNRIHQIKRNKEKMASLFGYTSTAEYEIAKQTAKQVAENMGELLREAKDELQKEKSTSKELRRHVAKLKREKAELERNIQTGERDHACTKGLLAFSKDQMVQATGAVCNLASEAYGVDQPSCLVNKHVEKRDARTSMPIIKLCEWMAAHNLKGRLNDTSVALNEAKEANKVIAAEKKALSQQLDEVNTELQNERENFVAALRKCKEKHDALERDVTDAKANIRFMQATVKESQELTRNAQDQLKTVQTGSMVMDFMRKKRKFNPALTDVSDE